MRRSAMRMCDVVSLNRPLMAGASCGALMIWRSWSSERARMPLGLIGSGGVACCALMRGLLSAMAVSAAVVIRRIMVRILLVCGKHEFDTQIG
jgi:hypothetical protein